MGRSR
jgi:hypothetical protein